MKRFRDYKVSGVRVNGRLKIACSFMYNVVQMFLLLFLLLLCNY